MIVDDLDRSVPDHVVDVLDAIRVFVSCRGVGFILAADGEVIDGAFRHSVESLGASGTRRAADALEKYIRHRIELPGIDALNKTNVTERIIRLQKHMFTDAQHDLLKGPPGLFDDGVGVAIAKSFPQKCSV